jgi:hypothetical protein
MYVSLALAEGMSCDLDKKIKTAKVIIRRRTAQRMPLLLTDTNLSLNLGIC